VNFLVHSKLYVDTKEAKDIKLVCVKRVELVTSVIENKCDREIYN
jgi:hypothetical protein